MKCIFTLGSPAIGGGTNVIFEHATKMVEQGEEVYIVTKNKVKKEEYSWHTKADTLKWVTYEEIKDIKFDVAIGTWWMTLYDMCKINAKKYIYFVQSIESKFYPNKEKILKIAAELTYFLDLQVITEATWIKKYLENYGIETYLVHNGIRKDIFNLNGPKYDNHEGLRVLIEGPVDIDFKNVPKTIELARKSKADEIWLLTSSDIKEYEGVAKVFSRVPPTECAEIYRSCDLIVKLSYVEGMFGPPLEMFHCGGTTIVYDVTGHDEYIKDKKNGYVVKTDDDEKVIEYINYLKENPKVLEKLKKEAIKTANNWVSWEESSIKFYKTVKDIIKTPSKATQKTIEKRLEIFENICRAIELERDIPIRKFIGNKLRKYHPRIYKIYRKLLGK